MSWICGVKTLKFISQLYTLELPVIDTVDKRFTYSLDEICKPCRRCRSEDTEFFYRDYGPLILGDGHVRCFKCNYETPCRLRAL